MNAWVVSLLFLIQFSSTENGSLVVAAAAAAAVLVDEEDQNANDGNRNKYLRRRRGRRRRQQRRQQEQEQQQHEEEQDDDDGDGCDLVCHITRPEIISSNRRRENRIAGTNIPHVCITQRPGVPYRQTFRVHLTSAFFEKFPEFLREETSEGGGYFCIPGGSIQKENGTLQIPDERRIRPFVVNDDDDDDDDATSSSSITTMGGARQRRRTRTRIRRQLQLQTEVGYDDLNLGSVNLLAVRVTSTLGEAPEESLEEIQSAIFGLGPWMPVPEATVVGQYDDMSHGALRFKPAAGQGITNGVIQVQINVPVLGSDIVSVVGEAAVAATNVAVGGNLSNVTQFIVFCLPDGSQVQGQDGWFAFTYINEPYSYYQSNRCTKLTFPVHELGHSMGLHHSGVDGDDYGDESGYMGYSLNVFGGPLRGMNAHKHYLSGWFQDKTVHMTPFLPEAVQGRLVAFVDYSHPAVQAGHVVVLRIGDLFIHYNRAKGYNVGTIENQADLVTIVTATENRLVSRWVASLGAGDSYAFTVTARSGNATVAVPIVMEVCDLVVSNDDAAALYDYALLSVHVENGVQQSTCGRASTAEDTLAVTAPPTPAPSQAPSSEFIDVPISFTPAPVFVPQSPPLTTSPPATAPQTTAPVPVIGTLPPNTPRPTPQPNTGTPTGPPVPGTPIGVPTTRAPIAIQTPVPVPTTTVTVTPDTVVRRTSAPSLRGSPITVAPPVELSPVVQPVGQPPVVIDDQPEDDAGSNNNSTGPVQDVVDAVDDVVEAASSFFTENRTLILAVLSIVGVLLVVCFCVRCCCCGPRRRRKRKKKKEKKPKGKKVADSDTSTASEDNKGPKATKPSQFAFMDTDKVKTVGAKADQPKKPVHKKTLSDPGMLVVEERLDDIGDSHSDGEVDEQRSSVVDGQNVAFVSSNGKVKLENAHTPTRGGRRRSVRATRSSLTRHGGQKITPIDTDERKQPYPLPSSISTPAPTSRLRRRGSVSAMNPAEELAAAQNQQTRNQATASGVPSSSGALQSKPAVQRTQQQQQQQSGPTKRGGHRRGSIHGQLSPMDQLAAAQQQAAATNPYVIGSPVRPKRTERNKPNVAGAPEIPRQDTPRSGRRRMSVTNRISPAAELAEAQHRRLSDASDDDDSSSSGSDTAEVVVPKAFASKQDIINKTMATSADNPYVSGPLRGGRAGRQGGGKLTVSAPDLTPLGLESEPRRGGRRRASVTKRNSPSEELAQAQKRLSGASQGSSSSSSGAGSDNNQALYIGAQKVATSKEEILKKTKAVAADNPYVTGPVITKRNGRKSGAANPFSVSAPDMMQLQEGDDSPRRGRRRVSVTKRLAPAEELAQAQRRASDGLDDDDDSSSSGSDRSYIGAQKVSSVPKQAAAQKRTTTPEDNPYVSGPVVARPGRKVAAKLTVSAPDVIPLQEDDAAPRRGRRGRRLSVTNRHSPAEELAQAQNRNIEERRNLENANGSRAQTASAPPSAAPTVVKRAQPGPSGGQPNQQRRANRRASVKGAQSPSEALAAAQKHASENPYVAGPPVKKPGAARGAALGAFLDNDSKNNKQKRAVPLGTRSLPDDMPSGQRAAPLRGGKRPITAASPAPPPTAHVPKDGASDDGGPMPPMVPLMRRSSSGSKLAELQNQCTAALGAFMDKNRNKKQHVPEGSRSLPDDMPLGQKKTQPLRGGKKPGEAAAAPKNIPDHDHGPAGAPRRQVRRSSTTSKLVEMQKASSGARAGDRSRDDMRNGHGAAPPSRGGEKSGAPTEARNAGRGRSGGDATRRQPRRSSSASKLAEILQVQTTTRYPPERGNRPAAGPPKLQARRSSSASKLAEMQQQQEAAASSLGSFLDRSADRNKKRVPLGARSLPDDMPDGHRPKATRGGRKPTTRGADNGSGPAEQAAGRSPKMAAGKAQAKPVASLGTFLREDEDRGNKKMVPVGARSLPDDMPNGQRRQPLRGGRKADRSPPTGVLNDTKIGESRPPSTSAAPTSGRGRSPKRSDLARNRSADGLSAQVNSASGPRNGTKPASVKPAEASSASAASRRSRSPKSRSKSLDGSMPRPGGVRGGKKPVK